MRSKKHNLITWNDWSALRLLTVCCVIGISSSAQQSKEPMGRSFDTREEAAQALTKAADDYDVPALLEILGPSGKDLVASQDPVADKTRAKQFVELARQKVSVTTEPKDPKHAIVSVGEDAWPLPIPLVNRNGKWYFDTAAGRQEILLRRIGANELDAIAVCRGYVEAQQEYASEKHDGSLLNQYAQRIISTPGKQDGLAWQNSDGTWGGPVGETIAKALAQGYSDKSQPFHGYFFKVLKAQGPTAPMGEMNFVVNGVMIGGFALAAAPAQYRVTGVQTFIVSQSGIVFQKDLGPDSLAVFQKMDVYNPDKTWHRTDDDWEN